FPGAVEEIKQTSQYFKQKYNVDKAFVCGFCMGGALSIASAVRTTEFAAAAPFYGIPPLALADPKKANCPIMGFFGERDNHAGFSDPAAAKKLDQALTEGGVEHEIIIYDNVDHAFMNADRPEVYNAEVAKKALAAMIQFFNKRL
ncbi:alpha/beta-hydrolase, partial [Ramicandelaber brevisporus]